MFLFSSVGFGFCFSSRYCYFHYLLDNNWLIVLILIRMIPTKIVMTVILAIIGVMTDNINASIDMDTDPTFLLRVILITIITYDHYH